ncbi:DUF6233 domain-containing protein [Streptomyces sp. NPDC052727]|uniref:DUF6233 domain-containing protein n=1 Tax=Streptomyces sp. NPDC052727 TaxID=3154854 RepID=UPI00342475EE
MPRPPDRTASPSPRRETADARRDAPGERQLPVSADSLPGRRRGEPGCRQLSSGGADRGAAGAVRVTWPGRRAAGRGCRWSRRRSECPAAVRRGGGAHRGRLAGLRGRRCPPGGRRRGRAWLIQYGLNRMNVDFVHTGECWAAAKSGRCRPVSREQALDALRQSVPPCTHCRPDTELGLLD